MLNLGFARESEDIRDDIFAMLDRARIFNLAPLRIASKQCTSRREGDFVIERRLRSCLSEEFYMIVMKTDSMTFKKSLPDIYRAAIKTPLDIAQNSGELSKKELNMIFNKGLMICAEFAGRLDCFRETMSYEDQEKYHPVYTKTVDIFNTYCESPYTLRGQSGILSVSRANFVAMQRHIIAQTALGKAMRLRR